MSQITLAALEKALAPLEELSRGEITFDVGETPVTMRLLTPEEETEVQKYASAGLSTEEVEGDEEASGGSALEYLERLKMGVISYAIVAVGEGDFRDVEWVETGETLDNGQQVKVARHMAIRQLVLRWGGSIRLGLYRKYTELVLSMEEKAEKAIKLEPADLDAEIERVEGVLQRLKLAKAEAEGGPASPVRSQFSEALQNAESIETEASDKKRAASDVVRARAAGADIDLPEEPQEAPQEPEGERRSIIPEVAPPPVPPTASAPEMPPPVPAPAEEAGKKEEEPPPTPFDTIQDSFLDPDDPEAAVAAANKQLLHAHLAGRGQSTAPVPDSVLTEVRRHSLQRPPHLDAAEAERALAEEASSHEELDDFAQQQAAQVGSVKVGDKEAPVFQLPAEALETKAVPAGAPSVNERKGGSINPRFRKPTTP